MDLETINKTVADRGYAFLTQAQKDAYNAKPTTPATVSTKAPTDQVKLSDQGVKDYYSSQTPLAAPMSPTEYGKKYPSAVASPTAAINDANKINQTATDANNALIAKQAEQKALADAAKLNPPPPQEKTTLSAEDKIANEPDPGNKWIYDRNGNRTQILASEAVPYGYTTTDQKGSAPVDEVSSGVSTYRKFADGSYGKFDKGTGTYQGFATADDFTKAQTQKQISDKIDQIALGNFVMSPEQQAQVDAVKAQYDRFIKEQEIANKNLTGGTTSRMALSGVSTAQFAMQKIAKTVSDGVDKISDINVKKNGAVSNMISAFKSDDLAALKSAYTMYQQDQKDLNAAFKDMHDETVQIMRDDKQQRETRINAVDNDIRSLQAQLLTAPGVTPGQQEKMQQALLNHDYNAAFEAAGDSLKSGQGWMGTYMDYAATEKAAGRTPMSPVEFKNWDDSNAASIARAGKAAEAAGGIAGALDAGIIPFQSTIELAASTGGSVTGQKRAEEQMANLAINGDYKSLLNRVKEEARKGMPSVDRSEVIKAEKQVKSLARMSEVLKKYQASGGNMNFLKGKEDTIATYFGKLGTDPKYKEIATELTAAFQQYRVDMTGAAFGAAESSEYESVLPSKGKNFDLNESVVSGLKTYMEGKVNDSYETQLGEGYKNIKELASGVHPLTQEANNAVVKLDTYLEQNPTFVEKAASLLETINPDTNRRYTDDEVLEFFNGVK